MSNLPQNNGQTTPKNRLEQGANGHNTNGHNTNGQTVNYFGELEDDSTLISDSQLAFIDAFNNATDPLLEDESDRVGKKKSQQTAKPKRVPTVVYAKEYLQDKYTVRYNIISNDMSISENNEAQPKWKKFETADLWLELVENNIPVTTNNVASLLKTSVIRKDYDPFLEYFENLKFNGEGHIEAWAKMVKISGTIDDTERWLINFKKHIIRTVNCALNPGFFNKQALVLVGKKHGTGKSSFCRSICPTELDEYLEENPEINKDGKIALSSNFIINLDELANISKHDINQLKSYLSTQWVKVRPPYGEKPIRTPRRASFFGSTNDTEFLTDRTGNVRWVCFEIESINYSVETGYRSLNINDLWAEAYYLYKKGASGELTSDETKANELANQNHMVISIEKEGILKYFSPCDNENDLLYAEMTTSEIMSEISKRTNCGKLNPKIMGQMLETMGFKKTSARLASYNNESRKCYRVKKLYNELLPLSFDNTTPTYQKAPY